MKVRGERDCKDCGTRWSYYETGSVECPACGSLRSVGVEDSRELHTDDPGELDLTATRDAVDAEPLRRVAEIAEETARSYVRRRGFVRGGDLVELDDTYLLARELRHVAAEVGRAMDVSDDEEWYFLELLRCADRDGRPAPGEVPASFRTLRGLAYGEAVREYRGEMADWADEYGADERGRDALETLGDHARRVLALDGDVDPEAAERLAAAARDVAAYLRDGDEDALVSARDRFGRLAE